VLCSLFCVADEFAQQADRQVVIVGPFIAGSAVVLCVAAATDWCDTSSSSAMLCLVCPRKERISLHAFSTALDVQLNALIPCCSLLRCVAHSVCAMCAMCVQYCGTTNTGSWVR
jgi:hypothetical protein